MWEEQISEAKEKYDTGGGGGDYFKFKEGKNRIRILEKGQMIAIHFVGSKGYTCFGVKEGCPYHGENSPRNEDGSPRRPSAKLITYVLDRDDEDQKPRLAEIPFSVIKQVKTFAEEKDYAFSDFPMPYDITVTYTRKAAPNDMYRVVPSATRIDVQPEVLEALGGVQPVERIVEGKKQRAQKAAGAVVDMDADYGDEE